jgi:hypothetical protein
MHLPVLDHDVVVVDNTTHRDLTELGVDDLGRISLGTPLFY